jgi:hypothetical protein
MIGVDMRQEVDPCIRRFYPWRSQRGWIAGDQVGSRGCWSGEAVDADLGEFEQMSI